MTNTMASILHKARYGLLLIPVLCVYITTSIAIHDAFPPAGYREIPHARISLDFSQIYNIAFWGLMTLWILVKILQRVKNGEGIAAELQSAVVFFLGETIMATSDSFPLWRFGYLLGAVITDIAAIIMLVTLLQGKPFGPLTLYHKEVQLQKIS